MRRISIVGTALIIWLSVVGVAEARPLPPIGETQVRFEMSLDCGSLSGGARQYAEDHKYCRKSHGQLVPMDQATGTCGSSWLYIRDTGIREATIRYGFSSSWGVVVSRQLFGYWSSTSGLKGNWTDISLMASTSYSTTRTRNTGYGGATAWVSGEVTLFWGGTCKLGQPIDYEFIS